MRFPDIIYNFLNKVKEIRKVKPVVASNGEMQYDAKKQQVDKSENRTDLFI